MGALVNRAEDSRKIRLAYLEVEFALRLVGE